MQHFLDNAASGRKRTARAGRNGLSIAGRKGPVLVHGGSDGYWLAWAVLFPEANTGVLVVANATGDMGGDKATKTVLGTLFADSSPAK